MDIGKLKEDVFEANLELVRRGLVLYTWGNVSGIDRERGLVVIKPSGVSYDVIAPSDYMIERLIDEKLLLELDYGNIPNFKYISDNCKNLYFDPEQKYTVCFNTGLTVLIYNKNLVKEEPDSWSVL